MRVHALLLNNYYYKAHWLLMRHLSTSRDGTAQPNLSLSLSVNISSQKSLPHKHKPQTSEFPTASSSSSSSAAQVFLPSILVVLADVFVGTGLCLFFLSHHLVDRDCFYFIASIVHFCDFL